MRQHPRRVLTRCAAHGRASPSTLLRGTEQSGSQAGCIPRLPNAEKVRRFVLLTDARRLRRSCGKRGKRDGRQRASRVCGTRNKDCGTRNEVRRSEMTEPIDYLLIIGSPTWARTRDLRINNPSEKWPESRIQLGFPGFRLGNRLSDFALVSPRSSPTTLFQFPQPV